MPTTAQLKTQFNTEIRLQTAPGSIDPDRVADQLDALADHIQGVRQTLTDGATVTMNVANGRNAIVTLAGNRTFAFSNLAANDAGIIEVRQDATGGRTLSWPVSAILPTGGLSLSAGANEVTLIGYYYNGAALYLSKENYGAAPVGGDTTPPAVVSRRVENATPNRIDILYNEALLGSSVPAVSAFAVSGGKTVTGVAISGSTVQITVNTPYASGDVITIGYTVPGSNQIKDAAGNNAPAIAGGTSVTNAISGSSYDSDAAAFFAATGNLAVGSLTDTTVKNAVNQLVVDLKAAGLWTNMKALYPFVGGSAATQKFNLKNPADTNGAFRMTWVGSDYTFDQTGVVIGAASLNNSYGDTNFNLASQVSNLNAFATGYYRRGTGFNSLFSPISVYAAADSRIILGVIGTDLFVDFWDFSQRMGGLTMSDFNGMISLVRSANNDMKLYRGNTAVGTMTTPNTGTVPNLNLLCGATNANGTPTSFNVANNLALFYMYDGALNGSNMTALSAAVDAFQTALSRSI